jgi:carbamoyl-phosphate synthase large subunit
MPLAEYLREPQSLSWPVIAKPNAGSASVGIIRPTELSDLNRLAAVDAYIVQELWQGREYTVNVFFDAAGRLRCAVPHRRIEVRAGEVSKGRTERVPALSEAASKLPAILPGGRGPMCFQAVVRDGGEYAVFEMNARFGGGYPLAHRAGARMSQWLLEELTGRTCSACDDWREGVTMLRYDAAVFVDE